MKLLNNTGANIYISDIGIPVPLASRGVVSITDADFNRSKDLILLVNSGKITILRDHKNINIFVKDGIDNFAISGDVIWNGEGKTKPVVRMDPGGLEKNLVIEKKRYASTLDKKYKIVKKVDSSISIEGANVILTKQTPFAIITETIFNKTELQKALYAGLIEVTEIFEPVSDESGKIDWVKENEVKKSKRNPFIVMDRKPEFNGVQCIWEGPIFDAGGYANMNRQYVINMTKMGVAVKPVLVETAVQIEEEFKNGLTKLSYTPVRSNCPKVYSTNVPGKHSGHTIAYTMMETEEKVHPSLAASMKSAQEIWVPSEWNKETFVNGGVTKNIKVMPLAIDETLYAPAEPRIFWDFPTKSYVFLSVSTWIWRKGYDVLLKAYAKAFNADDDVSLIIFTHVPLAESKKYTDIIRRDIADMAIKKLDGVLPNLTVVTSFLGASVSPLIYNSANCFALFSRGEGWGLPYCEAAASGLPIVGADHGGQKMFLNNDNSFLVKPDMVVGCHSTMLPISPFYHGMKFVSYSPKAIDEAAEKMRYVFDNREKAEEVAMKCRENLLENFVWKKSAHRVASRLREIK